MDKALVLAFIVAMTLSAPAMAEGDDATATALKRCLDDPVNASTGGQTDCEAVAVRSYDQRMNRAYASLMKKLPADARQRLLAAQRAWLVFRSAEDEARTALYETRRGTMYVPMQAAAKTDVIRDRTLTLESNLRLIEIEP